MSQGRSPEPSADRSTVWLFLALALAAGLAGWAVRVAGPATYAGALRASDALLGGAAALMIATLALGAQVRERAAHEAASTRADQADQASAGKDAARQRQAFLMEATNLLGSSLDFEETLNKIVHASLGVLGDYCVVDLLDEEQVLRRTAVAHADPVKEAVCWEMNRRYPPHTRREGGYLQVFRTGEPMLIPELTPAMTDAIAEAPEHREMLRTIGLKTYMVQPLHVRGRMIGVMLVGWTEPGRPYSEGDLALGAELARRSALAVDNARLYREAREAVSLLEETVAFLDTLVNSAPMAIGFVDREMRYVRVNEALAVMHGIPAADHLGRTIREVVPAVAEAAEGVLRGVLEKEEALVNWELTAETPAAPGVTRHWLEGLYPVKRRDGEVVGVGIIATEITERKRMEEGQAQKLHLLIHNLADGVVAVNSDQRLLFVNPAASRLLRLSGSEAATPEEAGFPAPLAESLRAVSTPNRNEPVQFTFQHHGAEIEVHISPVLTGLTHHGVIAILQDVTSATQYRQMQERFVANVSHELRGPLTSLSATIEALADGLIPEAERSRYLRAALGEVERLRRLSHEVLDLARLDSEEMRLKREEVSLDLLFATVQDNWTQRCRRQGLRLITAPATLKVRADYQRVEQVIANLLDNAVRFTGTGGEIRLIARLEGESARIIVIDTGVGIVEEHLPHLWTRFYKVDSARTLTPQSGTGLGLSIVRKLVEGMGGGVHVESRVGEGSAFSFTLPLA